MGSKVVVLIAVVVAMVLLAGRHHGPRAQLRECTQGASSVFATLGAQGRVQVSKPRTTGCTDVRP